MAAPAPKTKLMGSTHVTAFVHRRIITKHTNICSTAIIWKKLQAILQLILTLFKWDKKTFHPTTLYGQLYKKDTKRHILLSTCMFYVSLVSKNCPIFIWQYMEPNKKYFMSSTSSYSTLLPTYWSLRTTEHSTQLTQKPFSTFKPKITHSNKANILTLVLILSFHHCLCLLCSHFRRASIATQYSIFFSPPSKLLVQPSITSLI